MCGIAGIYHFDRSNKVEITDLRAMTDRIIHRGPDDEGHFVHQNIGLGMRRLSIIDIDGGHQPIFSEDRSKVIVFNGEVYNFVDHRDALLQEGFQLSSRTDTEVVLCLYQQFGLDFFEKLNGMYALAVWDETDQSLVLARDRIGIKPLYYYLDQEKLVFASEIKSILELPTVARGLDLEALSAYSQHGFTPAPYTLFQGIRKLPPGHFLRIRNGNCETRRYWEISYREKFRATESELAEELYALLKDSVRYRLVSDVPLGAFLSGGMDSSGIAHLMAELGTQTIKTYSIGFGKGYESYNELDSAGSFARDYSTSHHEILVEPQVADLFPKLIGYLDEPVADSSFIVTYLVSELARETVTVILSGVGGDELFGGYRRYLGVELSRYLRALPTWLRRGVLMRLVGSFPVDRNSNILNYFRLARGYLQASDLPLRDQYQGYTAIFRPELKAELLGGGAASADFYQRYFDECDSDELLDKITHFDLKTSLPEQLLLLTDKMSMATSLEARVPFLDHRLVEFAARIPSHHKIHGMKLRHIQKKAFENRLPDYVLKKKKKEFGAPIGTWVRNELREMVHDVLSPDFLQRQGIFSGHVVSRMLQDHYQKKEDYTDQILALVAFQLWHESYLKGAPEHTFADPAVLVSS